MLSEDEIKEFEDKFVRSGNWRDTGFTVPYVKYSAEGLLAYLSSKKEEWIKEGVRKVTRGEYLCPRHKETLRCLSCLSELKEQLKDL